MREKLREFWNKYKKYIIVAFILIILGIFLLNFIFVITDCMAGKGFNWKAIIYSPVSNEEWLSFIGNGIVGLATLLLFWIAKKSFENERNKIKYENEMKKIEKEKEIVEEYLKVFEINDIYDIRSQTLTSSLYKTRENDEKIAIDTISKRGDMIKKINFVQLKLDLNTNFRIELRGRFKVEKYEKEKKEIYYELIDLLNMYEIVLDNISSEISDLIKVEDLNERERKVISILKSENKINKETKEKFLDIFKKYKEEEFLKENLNSIKIENEVEYGNFSLIFNAYLNYVINKVKEYFINVEKDIEEEFLNKNL
jgi:DHH family protein